MTGLDNTNTYTNKVPQRAAVIKKPLFVNKWKSKFIMESNWADSSICSYFNNTILRQVKSAFLTDTHSR